MVKRKNNIHEILGKADYVNTFKCDECGKLINRANTVFTETLYGGRAWLCLDCADRRQLSVEDKEVLNGYSKRQDKEDS